MRQGCNDYQSVNRRESIRQSKSPGSSLRGLWRKPVKDSTCQALLWSRARCLLSTLFGEWTTEGGGVEPQWLMGHSPTWQVESSTHWQRPLDIDRPRSWYPALLVQFVTHIT